MSKVREIPIIFDDGTIVKKKKIERDQSTRTSEIIIEINKDGRHPNLRK